MAMSQLPASLAAPVVIKQIHAKIGEALLFFDEMRQENQKTAQNLPFSCK